MTDTEKRVLLIINDIREVFVKSEGREIDPLWELLAKAHDTLRALQKPPEEGED